jgi:hypothetical protein
MPELPYRLTVAVAEFATNITIKSRLKRQISLGKLVQISESQVKNALLVGVELPIMLRLLSVQNQIAETPHTNWSTLDKLVSDDLQISSVEASKLDCYTNIQSHSAASIVPDSNSDEHQYFIDTKKVGGVNSISQVYSQVGQRAAQTMQNQKMLIEALETLDKSSLNTALHFEEHATFQSIRDFPQFYKQMSFHFLKAKHSLVGNPFLLKNEHWVLINNWESLFPTISAVVICGIEEFYLEKMFTTVKQIRKQSVSTSLSCSNEPIPSKAHRVDDAHKQDITNKEMYQYLKSQYGDLILSEFLIGEVKLPHGSFSDIEIGALTTQAVLRTFKETCTDFKEFRQRLDSLNQNMCLSIFSFLSDQIDLF